MSECRRGGSSLMGRVSVGVWARGCGRTGGRPEWGFDLKLLPRRHLVWRPVRGRCDPYVHLLHRIMHPKRASSVDGNGPDGRQVGQEGIPERGVQDRNSHVAVSRFKLERRQPLLIQLPVRREVRVPSKGGVLAETCTAADRTS